MVTETTRMDEDAPSVGVDRSHHLEDNYVRSEYQVPESRQHLEKCGCDGEERERVCLEGGLCGEVFL